MTHEEIIEGNKLIAEFLWGKQGNPEDRAPEWYIGEDLPYCDEDGYYQNVGAMNPISSEIIQFHSSWDWLMPVVEKIINSNCSSAELCGEWYLNSSKYSFSMLNDQTNSCEGNSKNSLIEATWLAVVEFIKWYNQNK